MKTIGITGGTGFVGKHLTNMLLKRGDNVLIFTRDKNRRSTKEGLQYTYWNPGAKECDTNALHKIDGMVHLAGAGVADKRWTQKRKIEILESRTVSTHFLVSQLKLNAIKCKVFVGASAIGFYGTDATGAAPFTEDSAAAHDFLAKVCNRWEDESKKASDFVRTVLLRFGIVLGKEGGAFPQFAKPASFGGLPIFGSGKQVYSWIHVVDLCNMILFSIDHDQLKGIYNAVAPNPVSQKALIEVTGKAQGGLKLPVYVPRIVLKGMLGEMSTEVLKSCTVSAEKILKAGFTFQYDTIDKAVSSLV